MYDAFSHSPFRRCDPHVSSNSAGLRASRQEDGPIEGTVEAVQQGQIDISVGRRYESLVVSERTRILQSGAEVDASALRAGDRIVVQGVRLGSAQIEAREIRTGGQSDRAPMGSAPASGGHKH